jgi:hypothetical protein
MGNIEVKVATLCLINEFKGRQDIRFDDRSMGTMVFIRSYTSKIAQAKLIRTKSKARFLLHFDDLVNVSKRISEINLSAIEGEIPNNPKPNTTRSF